MSHPPRPSPAFEYLLRGSGRADLERVAIEIASDLDPAVDPEKTLSRLDELADRVRPRVVDPGNVLAVLRQINWVLFVEEGFQGDEDDYYDPRNSLLHEVLDRRRGIPISLSLVYRGVARRLGVELEGVNLPLHFVLRTMPPAPERFIDPFHAGRLLDRQACLALVASLGGQPPACSDESFAPCSDRQFAARMLLNLVHIYQMQSELVPLVPLLSRLVQLESGSAVLHIQLAEAYRGLGQPGAALRSVESFLDRTPAVTPATQALVMLRSMLRAEIAQSN